MNPPAPSSSAPVSTEPCRVDRWLWSVRIFKTRNLATAACRGGHVSVAGVVVKAARELRIGDVVTVQDGLLQRTLSVRALPPARVGARLVADFCEDRTPPGEVERVRASRVQQILARDRGAGRPTKRDRRRLDDVFRSP